MGSVLCIVEEVIHTIIDKSITFSGLRPDTIFFRAARHDWKFPI